MYGFDGDDMGDENDREYATLEGIEGILLRDEPDNDNPLTGASDDPRAKETLSPA